ncbi:MAG TPA: DegT/DnrJ/EryC1/StrS family aminotransferase [Candidatus Polarisedimenticolia bacterium]|nr:DegT/DnrJ/EryC1/StrS family aminotransferase [Candidatus Polarisedimenticolia bacterium]
MSGARIPPGELALFGGAPAFPAQKHVGSPNIGDRRRLLQRMEDILDRRWLTNGGPYEQEFEKRVAAMLGVKHCIAMCNATVGLEIAIRALGMTGEVILPSFTFIATAHALQWQQIRPVFCDIDPATHTIDPRKIEALITPRTTGILGVHLWGRPCDVEAIEAIARRRGLKVLYDAAHAFGCGRGGRRVGGFGGAEVFSFHATKFVNTFEGGAITTGDDDLAARLRLMKNFGFVGYDDVGYIGTNGKMTEIAAAMGLTSLESLAQFVAVNRRNHGLYREALAGLPGVRLMEFDDVETPNHQYVVLEVDETRAALGRDELAQVLWSENIIARRYFFPGCHRMEPYRTLDPAAGERLPETNRVAARVLSLPTNTGVDPDEIATIGRVMRRALEQGERVRRALAGRAPATPIVVPHRRIDVDLA